MESARKTIIPLLPASWVLMHPIYFAGGRYRDILTWCCGRVRRRMLHPNPPSRDPPVNRGTLTLAVEHHLRVSKSVYKNDICWLVSSCRIRLRRKDCYVVALHPFAQRREFTNAIPLPHLTWTGDWPQLFLADLFHHYVASNPSPFQVHGRFPCWGFLHLKC